MKMVLLFMQTATCLINFVTDSPAYVATFLEQCMVKLFQWFSNNLRIQPDSESVLARYVETINHKSWSFPKPTFAEISP